MSKFYDRLTEAKANNEADLLQQFNTDLAIADEDGSVDTEEYIINKNDDGTFTIIDKMNDNEESIVTKGIGGELCELVSDTTEDQSDKTPIEPDENGEEILGFSLKKFSGTLKDGKLIIRLGDYDIELDTVNNVANVLDMEVSFPIDYSKSVEKVIEEVKKNLKKNDLKNFSNINNLKNFSKTTRRFFLDRGK